MTERAGPPVVPSGATGAAVPTSLRVLLVEDDDGDALLVTEHLSMAAIPIAVTRASSIAQARHVLATKGIDCVLLDLGLPDAVDGSALDAVVRIRAAAVVVLTGLADSSAGVDAVAAGAQDFLVKGSVDSDVLVRSMLYAVERVRSERAVLSLRESELRSSENLRLERGLLPAPKIEPDGVYRVSVKARPSRGTDRLGGDFYDVLERSDGSLLAVVGDVSGHGTDEAALGVSLRISWRALVLAGVPVEQLLPALSQVLMAERRDFEHFATALMIEVAASGRARVWSAGHVYALTLTTDGRPAAPLPVRVGPPLGLLDEHVWSAEDLVLTAPWRVLLYTDGLVEGALAAVDGELFGSERLAELVGQLDLAATADLDLLDAVVDEVDACTGGGAADDLAMVLVRRDGADAS